ncbi:kinase-like domain-containing protein [Mycena vitilis]|nr:kinase-like domain-containing protein [Mycena vitilis]
MSDPYVYSHPEDTEDHTEYVAGGFFPVKLGDVLGERSTPDSSRYRISTKLGHGSYSTVWLARDLVAKRTVAVKIVQASAYATSREVAILRHLRTPIPDPPAVLQLLDSFTVTSGNGIHQAIVTEPVILLERFLKLRDIKVDTRRLVRQALEGLAFIHERGIAHGGQSRGVSSSSLGLTAIPDLYPSNIGVVVPDLDNFSEVDIWERGGPPTILPLVTFDPAHDATSYPPYLTTSLDLGKLLERDAPGFLTREPRVRILDLGSYIAEDGPSPPCHTPHAYASPEVTFPRVVHGIRDAPWDRSADIWSLACTVRFSAGYLLVVSDFVVQINDIAGGVLLFGSQILSKMALLCGGAPVDWIAYFASLPDTVPPRNFTPEAADAFWAKTEYPKRGGQTTEEIRGLVALLRRMLVLDPMQRPSALNLLQDPYFISGDLPTTPSNATGTPMNSRC